MHAFGVVHFVDSGVGVVGLPQLCGNDRAALDISSTTRTAEASTVAVVPGLKFAGLLIRCSLTRVWVGFVELGDGKDESSGAGIHRWLWRNKDYFFMAVLPGAIRALFLLSSVQIDTEKVLNSSRIELKLHAPIFGRAGFCQKPVKLISAEFLG